MKGRTTPTTRFLPPLLGLGLAACASGPEPTDVEIGHNHRITTLVTVTGDALLPGADVRIPAMSTVVWRNVAAVPLTIDVDSTTCASCETVLGFRSKERGAGCRAVAPGGVASLCFHEAGSFPFVVHLEDRELRGTIVVGAAP